MKISIHKIFFSEKLFLGFCEEYFCNPAEIMQARCANSFQRDLFSVSSDIHIKTFSPTNASGCFCTQKTDSTERTAGLLNKRDKWELSCQQLNTERISSSARFAPERKPIKMLKINMKSIRAITRKQ